MSAIALVNPNQGGAAPAASLTLFTLSEELTTLMDTADMVEEGTVDRAELDAAIVRFQAALPAKVDGVCWMLSHLEAQAELAAKEIKRLQARKKRMENGFAHLEAYCITVLEALPEPKRGPKKLEGNTNTLALSPSDRCVITDEPAIPTEYKTVAIEMPATAWEKIVETCGTGIVHQLTKQDLKVRLADVKKALKAGLDVAGADLQFCGNLRRS